MNKADVQVYKDIQKNTEMGMKAIDAIRDKCGDEDFVFLLTKQNAEYHELYNKAENKLIDAKVEPYRGNAVDNFFLKIGIHMNTLLNTSTSHMAELMIRERNTGVTKLWKSLNHNSMVATEAAEMAKEFIHLEEDGIEALKKYL